MQSLVTFLPKSALISEMLSLQTIACVLLAAAQLSFAAIYDQSESLPTIKYDFIVIGGGTAGNVIANRLTEDPRVNVLVLESGPSSVFISLAQRSFQLMRSTGRNEGVLNSIVPFFATSLGGTVYDWNFTTTAQHGLNGRSIAYPRGHILGGSSSINAMFYTRGSSSDFDRFAAVTRDPGWSWNNIQSYIRKNERWTTPADHHNTTGQFNPSIHGFRGINAVSLSGFPQPTDPRVIQATVELSQEFPFNQDANSGSPLGLGWLQTTIDHGKRSSSATSYLGPKFINRPNLHVLLHARVTRVLQTKSNGRTTAIRTVEFTDENRQERRITLTASKELILSAGTIGTPHILLNSGIGDLVELEAMGIIPVANLPSVGKNLSDQPALGNAWFVNSNDTLDNITNNATLRAELLKQWEEHKTGPLVASSASHIAWARLPANSSIFESFADPSAGLNTPHYELVIGNGGGLRSMQGHFMSVGVIVVTPVSRGAVSLRSSNPLDPPVIDVAFLTSGFDIFAMREAIKSAIRFVSAPVWKDYIIGPAGNLANATTDSLLEDYARRNTFSSAHPVGTAAMSAVGAEFGVVDPDLRVKGVSGLRIVDASIMPFVTSGHTQAPVYIIAERAADMIKDTWRLH